ncbi:MAG TPA: rhomboid family intramembrane serine protease [Solirubrobacteraceae bacterium]|jgi:membrane associated rhomboid family serine protease|nr:rhomboid family intramembrane serine protease [Solirubrobacteraceae bacterium]
MLDALADRLSTRLFGRPSNKQQQGLLVLAVIVALMWLVESINTLDSNHLNSDGIRARSISHFWGILTSPFIHESFQHLIDNTVPFVFLGVIIALHGAGRLLLVTGFIIVIGGLGTWIIGPGGTSTVGASGVVFGYASYLLSRGFFDRSIWELGVGMVVGVVWGAALVSSLVPHSGISWQAHLCGGIAGVIVAWRLSQVDHRRAAAPDKPPQHDVIDFAEV